MNVSIRAELKISEPYINPFWVKVTKDNKNDKIKEEENVTSKNYVLPERLTLVHTTTTSTK